MDNVIPRESTPVQYEQEYCIVHDIMQDFEKYFLA